MTTYKNIQKENNQLENQINAENEEAYQKVILYLRGANINIYQQELIRQDLLHLVLDGQARGERIEDVLGDDLQAVADEIIASVPQMTNVEKFLQAISLFLRVTLILGAIKAGSALLSWLTINDSEAVVELGLADIFLDLAIALVSVFIIYKIVDDSLLESDQSTKKSNVSLFLAMGLIFTLIASFPFLPLELNPVLMAPSLVTFAGGLFVLLILMWALDQYIERTYHY